MKLHMQQIRQVLITPGGIGVSASASVLPINIQDWSPLAWTGWISLLSKVLSRVFSNTTVQIPQWKSSNTTVIMLHKLFLTCPFHSMGFPSGTVVKNPLPMQETQELGILSLGWEDPQEKEMATLSSILSWGIPWTEEPGGLQSMGLQMSSRHGIPLSDILCSSSTRLFTSQFLVMKWRSVVLYLTFSFEKVIN